MPDEATANGTTELAARNTAVPRFACEKTQADAEETVAPTETVDGVDVQTILEKSLQPFVLNLVPA